MNKNKARKPLHDYSTENVTPPQPDAVPHSQFQCQKPFTVPTSEGLLQLGPNDKVSIDVEYYDVMYTKHLQQKQKVWEDGFMEYHIKNSKLILFARNCRANQLDNKFFRLLPDLKEDEEFKLNKYIVRIEQRRKEGKVSVKRESQLEARRSKSSKSKFDLGKQSPLMIKGEKTGSVGKGLPTAMNAFPKRTGMGFKNRTFVCPQKVKEPELLNSDSDNDQDEQENLRKVHQQREQDKLREIQQKQNQHRNEILNQNGIGGNSIYPIKQQQERFSQETSGNAEYDQYLKQLEQRRREAQERRMAEQNLNSSINLNQIKALEQQIIKNDLDIYQDSGDDEEEKFAPTGNLDSTDFQQNLSLNIVENHPNQQDKPKKKDLKDLSSFIKQIAANQGLSVPQSTEIDPEKRKEFEKQYLAFQDITRNSEEAQKLKKSDPITDLYEFDQSEEEQDEPRELPKVLKNQSSLESQQINKKRKFDEFLKETQDPEGHHEYGKFNSTAVEKKISSGMKKRLLTDQIQKQNALDRLKEIHEKTVSDKNQSIKSFSEATLDFAVRHPIYQFPRDQVLHSRESYAGFYILAVLEMLKYSIKEDYDNQRTEMQLIPIILEYTKPSQSHQRVLQNANFKNIQNRMKKRKQAFKKKGKGAGGLAAQRQNEEESSSESEQEENHNSGDESDGETPGSFYVKFKDFLPPLVKKDMMVEDLWILMKRPMVTNQNLADVSEMLFVKNQWHGHNKQLKIKVSIIGSVDEVRNKVDQYKYAFKSVNLNGFSSLVENLIEFRERSNPYVDSMLSIKNSKAKFKVLKKCDNLLVEAVRQTTCIQFRLNRDQECVLNEVTKWFLARSKTKNNEQAIDDILGGLETNSQQKNPDDHSNVILVHGAFGCGKSYLLVAIIRFICTLLDQIGDTQVKILVCALTNIAVDRILLMLKNSEFEDFARVGSLKKINKHLLKYTHHSASNKKQADKEAIRELEAMMEEIRSSINPNGKMNQNQYEELMNIQESINHIRSQTIQQRIELLMQKRVVGATCASTGFEVMKNMQFKIVILDECSQMLEPQSLLPISRFNCRKLIAVGDPLQLPPIISFNFKEKKLHQQQILEESKNKVRTQNMIPHLPLFVRLMKEQFYCILLRTQYRCHPMIAQIANDLFYENYLENGVKADARKQLIKEFQPVTFISAEKGQESKSEFSYRNYYEAKFIVALLDYLCCLICQKYSGNKQGGYESSSSSEEEENKSPQNENQQNDAPDFSIGVIVTYKSQEELINQMIIDSKNEALKAIQVSTVDAFQGAERDIIIVGCVRTRSLGFIEDCRRLNVAITRARRHLIVVGKETLLTQNCHWKYIIDKAKNKTDKVYGYKKVNDFIEKGGLFKHMLKDFQ
eukprot:403357339